MIQKPKVTTVDSYDKAVDLIRQSSPDRPFYDLVIADLNLNAKSSGIDIFQIFRARQPQGTFLLISGTPLDEFMALIEGHTGEVPAYLPKPFRLDQCRSMLEWLLREKTKKAA